MVNTFPFIEPEWKIVITRDLIEFSKRHSLRNGRPTRLLDRPIDQASAELKCADLRTLMVSLLENSHYSVKSLDRASQKQILTPYCYTHV